jgi:uncharacterized protein YehS (DUF1456 family)
LTNNDVLRRIRYVFNFSDDTMIEIFGLGSGSVTRAEISDWMKQDDNPDFKKLIDIQLAIFLNGLIVKKRGKKDGPLPAPEAKLNNNIIFRKLKIALDFKEEDVLAALSCAGFPIGKHELSAFFRKSDHKNYRQCQTQILRNFLKGLQLKFRPDCAGSVTAAPVDDDRSDR